MKIIAYLILCSLFIIPFLSYCQVVEDAAEEAVAVEAYGPIEEVPADLSFGNPSDPNYISFMTPSGTITVYYPEVLLVDEGDGYSVHFPLFGVAPIIPDYMDITPKEVFRRGQTGGLVTLSLAFDDQGEYNFLRDHISISLFECHEDFDSNYRRGITSKDISNMTHYLDRSGNNYLLDFNSTWKDDDSNQLIIHAEAKPSPAIKKDIDTNAPNNVYYFPDMGLLAYQEGSYSFFGSEKFIPLPEGDVSRSGYFDPESFRVYEFESLSENDISFDVYSVKAWEGDIKYDQVILDPVEDGNPDISKVELTDEMLSKSIEATSIYTIDGPSVILNHNDLSEALQYCTYPPKYEKLEPVIGSNELPASQTLAVKPNDFRSFKLINNRLEGLSFEVEENTITQKKTSIENLVTMAKYQKVKEKAGKDAEKLFDFTYEIFTSFQELQKKPLDWWKSKARDFKVKNIEGDNPQAYAEGILRYFYGEDDDVAEMIVFMKSAETEVTLETLEQISAEKNSYSERFWVDMTIDKEGKLVTASHHRRAAGKDISVSCTYEGDQMVVELAEEGGETFKRSLSGAQGLMDYHFILAALPAMKLKSGFQNELYLTDWTGTTFGGDYSVKPVFNKVNIEVVGEESIDFLNEQIDTYQVQLKFLIRPENPTVSIIYPAMIMPDGSDFYQLNVWVSKKDNMPVRLQTNGGSYWLFNEDMDISKWSEWMRNKAPDPFGL